MVSNMVLENDPQAKGFKIVRAHRLGKYRSGVNRPIIVKYREYSEKMKILHNRKNLKGKKMGISEDFSAATVKDREFLSNTLLAAEEEMADKLEYGFIKYKSLVIKDCSGK